MTTRAPAVLKKTENENTADIFAKKLISDRFKGYIIFWSDQIQRSAKTSKLRRSFYTLPSSVFRPSLKSQKAGLALWHCDTFQMVWNNCSAFGVNLAHIWDSTTNSWEKFTWKKVQNSKNRNFSALRQFLKCSALRVSGSQYPLSWLHCGVERCSGDR